MNRCYTCRQEISSDLFRCNNCSDLGFSEDKKHRVGLDDWERMKLGWYRSEKDWHNNIKNREFRFKDGKKVVVLTDGRGNVKREMPTPRPLPPKEK